MLVLTRKPNQKIRIGENIIISVVRVTGNTIRLGIDAPKDVRIIRSELERRETETSSSEPASEEVLEEPPSDKAKRVSRSGQKNPVVRPEEFSRREDPCMYHAPLGFYTAQIRHQKYAVAGT